VTVWIKTCLVCTIYKYLEIPIRNTNLNYSIEYISRRQKGAYMTYSTYLYIVIQYLSVDKLYKRQLAELSAILNSFYTTITNDHIGVEVGGSVEPWKWWVFSYVEVHTARRSHLRLNWVLDITNSSQFDGQAFWLAVWRFSTG